MKDHEVILGVLRSIARRMWIRRALQEIGFGVCVVLFSLSAFQLVQHAFVSVVPAAGTGAHFAIAATLIALAFYIAWRASRRVTLAHAAAEADSRAGLRDELKSAYWFASAPARSAFEAVQVARAAATAARLDLAAIVPGKPPRSLFAAAALGLALVLSVWIAPQLSHSWGVAGGTPVSAAAGVQNLRALLEDVADDAQVEKLDHALQALQNTDSSAEEKTQAVAQARDAMEQVNLEAAAAREELARLAETLRANPDLKDVAEALEAGRTREAMALLQQARSRAGGEGARDGENEGASSRADEGGSRTQASPDQPAREEKSVNARADQKTIDGFMQDVRNADEKIDIQTQVNQVMRQMDNLLAANSQRSPLSANPTGNSANAPSPNAAAASSPDVQSGSMRGQMSAADLELGKDGARVGSGTGESEALPLEGAATRRLDAQLKRENIRRSESADGKKTADKDWFYSASRSEQSAVGFEDAKGANFDRSDAVGGERIPVRQQQIVKNYFLKLHESEKK